MTPDVEAPATFVVGGVEMKRCSLCSRAVPVDGPDAWRSHSKNCPSHRPPRAERAPTAPRSRKPREASQRARCAGSGLGLAGLEVTKPGEKPRVRCPLCSGSVGTDGKAVGFHYARGSR